MVRSSELELRELANKQGGYFTARQAVELGFVRNHSERSVRTIQGTVANPLAERRVSPPRVSGKTGGILAFSGGSPLKNAHAIFYNAALLRCTTKPRNVGANTAL